MPVAAIAGIGSALIGASSASKAAKAQSRSADAQMQLQREMFEQTREDLSPYRDAGGAGLDAYLYEMGLGAAPKGYEGFTATPGYDFRLQSGNDSINALAGARGGLNSGSTLKALADYNQNIASDEYGNYMTRLGGLTDMGSSAAAGQASANNAFAQMGSNSLAQQGNAASAGAIGVNNALQGGLQTGIGLWQYQNNLNSGLKPTGWT